MTVHIAVLYKSITTLSQLLAPFIPFMADEMYTNLTGEKSVHLTSYPAFKALDKGDRIIVQNMRIVRQICSLGNAQRKETRISIRQPLARVKIYGFIKIPDVYEEIILQELNVKKLQWMRGKGAKKTVLDTRITPALKTEGDARKLIRKIQNLRRAGNLGLTDNIVIFAPIWPKVYEKEIVERTLAVSIHKSDKLRIEKY